MHDLETVFLVSLLMIFRMKSEWQTSWTVERVESWREEREASTVSHNEINGSVSLTWFTQSFTQIFMWLFNERREGDALIHRKTGITFYASLSINLHQLFAFSFLYFHCLTATHPASFWILSLSPPTRVSLTSWRVRDHCHWFRRDNKQQDDEFHLSMKIKSCAKFVLL